MNSVSHLELDEFTRQIHQSLDFEQTASNVANEVRRVLECDRVTVFQKQGRAFRTIAISGQPTVNRRSNTVRALLKLANATLSTAQPFWFPTDGDVPSQIERPLNEYIQLSMLRSLVLLPVFDRAHEDSPDPTQTLPPRKVIGGLAIEKCSNAWNPAEVKPQIDTVTDHAAVALRNADQVSNIFLYPFWRAIGRTKAATTARHLRKWFMLLCTAALLTLAMIFVPTTFNLHCQGTLVPTNRQKVFADQTGTVSSVHVQHGDSVTSDETLLVLKNDELEIQIEEISGELETLKERLQGNRSIRISNRGRDSTDRAEIGQKELQTKIASLERRLKTVQRKRDRLQIKAPISGQVLTWDVTNLLKDRPVRQGELLVELADTNGAWGLELDLADRKIGHLMRAMDQSDEPLSVRFTLAAEPGRTFSGAVRQVAHTTYVNDEQMKMIRIHVDIPEADLHQLKYAGSSVSAKIDCGTRQLGFVWLHDAWEFIQYRLWFPLW